MQGVGRLVESFFRFGQKERELAPCPFEVMIEVGVELVTVVPLHRCGQSEISLRRAGQRIRIHRDRIAWEPTQGISSFSRRSWPATRSGRRRPNTTCEELFFPSENPAESRASLHARV